MIQPEAQYRLSGNANFLSAGYYFRTSARAGPSGGSDGCTLSATGHGSDNRAQDRSATDKLTCPFVFPQALPATFQFLIRRADPVSTALHYNGIDIQRNVAVIPYAPGDQPGIATPRDSDHAIRVANVLFNLRYESLAFRGVSRIDAFV